MKILISIEIDSFEELARVGSVLAQANVQGKVEVGGMKSPLGQALNNATAHPTPGMAMAAAQAAVAAPAPPKPALASVPLPATPPPAPVDMKGLKTMRMVVVALQAQGAKTLAEVLEKCRALKGAELVPVLNVIADEDLEDRVTTACESLGVG